MPRFPTPTFPVTPPIAEVILEVDFSLAQGQPWNPSFVGDFFTKIQPRYPIMEPLVEQGVEFQRQGDTFVSRALPPRQRALFRPEAGGYVVQLMEGRIVLNVLPLYPGWARVRQEMGAVWETLQQALPPPEVSRLGLRYVNKFARAGVDDLLARWLHEGPYVSQAVLSAQGEFTSTQKISRSPSEVVQVILAGLPPGQDAPFGTFVFDIHCAIQASGKGMAMLDAFDNLHGKVRSIFDEAKGQALQKLMTPPAP